MAATLPVAGPRVIVIPVGPFGGQVARLLTSGDGYRPGAADDLEPSFAAGVTAVIIATWRACPSLFEQADELALRYEVPWLPVVMEHPRLRIGPWVDPQLGPCYLCYQQRKIQHDRQHAATSTLEAAYDRDPDCGPGGYLPHHARVAAGVAAMTVRSGTTERRARDSGPCTAGQVSLINVLTWQTATHRVLARHGCRCGQAGRIGSGLTAVLARTRVLETGRTR